MNILQDLLGLFKRRKFVTPKAKDMIPIGVDKSNIALGQPDSVDMKLVRVSDLAAFIGGGSSTQLTPTEIITAIDSSIGTGWKREDFATTAQGTKADSAVQTTGSNYSFANVISSTLVTLTISAGSVNWDADGRNLHKIVLTGNCTLENGSNPISGTQYQFIIEQDGTGNHTLSYGNLFKFPGGTPPTIPVAPNSKSIITCLFDGTHYLAVSAENFS